MFFIFAKHSFISDSHNKKPDIFSKVGFRNPWCPDDDDDEKIHIDWEDEFNEDLIAKGLNEFVKPWVEQNEFKNWFLIWVPLRSINYPHNPECLLNENFFYEDQEKKETQVWEEIFGRELDRKILFQLSHYYKALFHFRFMVWTNKLKFQLRKIKIFEKMQ